MNSNRKPFQSPLRIQIFDGHKEIVNRIFSEYPIVLGRGAQCDIPLSQFDFISRQHCAVIEEGGCPFIVDLNSSNGFMFEGQKVKKAPVAPDTDIRIGNLKIIFEILTQQSEEGVKTRVTKSEDPQVTEISTPNAVRSPLEDQEWLRELQAKGNIKIPKPHQKSSDFSDKNIQTEIESVSDFNVHSAHAAKVLNRPQIPPTVRDQIGKATPKESAPVSMDALFEKLLPHPHADKIKPNQRILEGFVTWADQVYDVRTFRRGQRVQVGCDVGSNLNLPTLRRNINFAVFNSSGTTCFVPPGASVEVRREGRVLSMSQLMAGQALVSKNNGHILKLGDQDLCTVELDPKIRVHFRYAPMPRMLSQHSFVDSDDDVRKSTLISGFLHLFIAILAALNAPKSHAPKIPNVEERYARLIVEPPRQILPEPKKEEPKKEEPKKIVEKRKEVKQKVVRKEQPVPRKVVIHKSPKLKEVNKFPMKVAQQKPAEAPVKPEPKPVNVEQVGALAALNAFSAKPTNSKQPVAININQNAGGAEPTNTGGTIGLLKSATGRLPAGGGMAGVKTKGLGYGTGTGFGVQGVKGSSGARGVMGAVVGSPQLTQVGPSEGLTRAQVMAVVQKYLGKIQACYERSLIQAPGLAGRVEYEWEISPNGSVTDARVKKSEVADADSLNSCVVAVFKTMHFPQAKNGQSTTPHIGFPFGRM